MNSAITDADIRKFSKEFSKDRTNAVAMNAAVRNGVNAAAANYLAKSENQFGFSIDIDSGDVCDQKHSGRCWMFASLNLMRLEVMKKLNIKNMELSQSYPLFYDKLEKSNYFLENILETLDEPLDGRVIAFLLESPLGDGGQWDMFRSLIAKYGVVPQDVMPESSASSNTTEMDKYLTLKLREYAQELRSAAAKRTGETGLRKMKDYMMSTIYRMLCISLGTPPEKFTWETKDKDGKFIRIKDITPVGFFEKYVGWDLDDYVTVINAPTADKPFGRTYTVQYLGNVKGGKYPVKYLNLPMEDMKKLVIDQLRDGQIVWFGSDVGQFSDKDAGFLSLDAFNVKELFNTDFPMTKAQRLDYGESAMTHAMAITGVNLDPKGVPDRWKVENSWGKKVGNDGYFVMSDEWFSEFVYQILLNRKYFTKEQKAQFAKKPVVLKPWDPMGTLAQ